MDMQVMRPVLDSVTYTCIYVYIYTVMCICICR